MKKKSLILILLIILLFSFFFILDIKWICPFKHYLNIRCVGCGLTRAIEMLLQFKILQSIKYNILGIPLLIFIVVIFCLLIIDLIKNNNHFYELIKDKVYKCRIVIIVILILTMTINNINKI